jgi:hypothetical protein
MKIISFCFILLFLKFNPILYCQTYYNPRENINITLTVKEPYKPVNYAEFGRNFNNALNAETAKREALKNYYDQIYFETKNSIITGTYLTNDNSINNKILLLQSASIENLDALNQLLKNGMYTPDGYELQIRSTYSYYISTNQLFLNISRYQYNKLNEITNDSLKAQFNNRFRETLNSINAFGFDPFGVKFKLIGLTYPSSNSNKLYEFITSSTEDSLEVYKSNWNEIISKKEKEEKLNSEFVEKRKKEKKIFFELRDNYLNKISEEQKSKYLKSELSDFTKRIKKSRKKFDKIDKEKLNYFIDKKNNQLDMVYFNYLNDSGGRYSNNHFFEYGYLTIVEFFKLNSN